MATKGVAKTAIAVDASKLSKATNFGKTTVNTGITPVNSGSTVAYQEVAQPTNTLKTQYEKRKTQTQNQLNNIYDKQYQTQAAALKRDYDKNMSDRQAALDRIAPQYQNAANQMAISYEKSRRNANMNAMNSGLNTGTALQQQNALNSQWLSGYSGLRSEEAGAINSANQAIADLTTGYNNSLADTRASINNQRDQAIVDAQKKDREWYENQAQLLAQNGDFTAYKDIYGAAQAKVARNAWIASNPDAALRSGMISESQYRKITGKDYDPKAQKK